MQIPVKTVLNAGGEPGADVMKLLVRANALAGLGDAMDTTFSYNMLPGMGGLGVESTSTPWSSVMQQLALIGGQTASQVLLNRNQAKSVEYNPRGTTAYYPPMGGPSIDTGSGGMGINPTMLMLFGLGAVALVMFAKR